MAKPLDKTGKELDTLLKEIKKDMVATTVKADTDREEMMTFKNAFSKSLKSRKLEAENEEFRSYNSNKAFYNNHLRIII